MSLKNAALEALLATDLYRHAYRHGGDLSKCYDQIADANISLHRAIEDELASEGYAENQHEFDAVRLFEAFAKKFARDPKTAMLAGAIIRAIGQHRAETLTKTLLAAE